ncbi:PhoH family protein [uncultured Treponema sp.]|uniref:PhoH family protein n=1 Tax=uncultured Treponema sp. TaxID=162155 RepID=UPI0015BDC192|nr:PhoH family protein [uncultured Treponema sp.]
MEKEFTIVLSDPQILSQVCGTNDSNLRLIERHLGVSIFTRGNELSISDTSAEIRQEFKFIIDRLTDELSENGSDYGADGQELVESVLNTGFEKTESENFNALDFSISIPGSTRKIYPKTKNQARLVEAFRKSTMVFATGPAGCGKTFLAVAESLRLLLSHRVSSIILVRPIVEAGESLGFLPGDMQDKINPYLRPLYDSMSACIPAEILKKLQENGIIEAVPLAYMRGRTLNNAAVILDEAQNATCGQMKLFLTRIGENSKVFITGDVTQIDLPHRIPSGLVQALGILRNIEEISMVELDSEDVMRSPLVKKIVRAYENDKIE